MKRSPLFQVLVTKCKERVHEAIFEDALSELLDDTKVNMKVIRQLRDGDFMDPKVARVQLGAAALLFDRQMPKTVHTTREVTGTVTLEKRDASRLAAIEAEDDTVVDTTAVALKPTRFEDFAASYKEDESDDGA